MKIVKKRCTGLCLGMLLRLATHAPLLAQSPDIAQQIATIMSKGASGTAHERFIHAKGIVCQSTFDPSPGAASVSRAAHFTGGTVPVVVRFSDGAPDTAIPDASPDASPREWRFGLRLDSEPTLWRYHTTGS